MIFAPAENGQPMPGRRGPTMIPNRVRLLYDDRTGRAHEPSPRPSEYISDASTSDRFTITAKTDRCGEERRGDHQADPQTGSAQEFHRVEQRQRIEWYAALRVAVESFRIPSNRT